MRFKIRYLGMAVLGVLAIAILGWLVMTLWNAVIPAAFIGAHTLDYLHALGLLVLSRILFGGFRGRGGWHRHRQWRRWEGMTEEERTQFREGMRSGRCRPREA